MRRRAFLATAGTVALAGCAASGDEGPTYSIRGLENSDVYHDGRLESVNFLDGFTQGIDATLRLEYDHDAEYDPLENEVLLLDGERVVSEGGEKERLFEPVEQPVRFELVENDIDDGGPWDVISKGPRGDLVDEFELEIVRVEGESSE